MPRISPSLVCVILLRPHPGPNLSCQDFVPNSNSGKVYKVNPFPTSMIIYEESEEQSVPKLLHYRFHGMSDFTQRWKSVDLRRGDINIKNNFGTHYGTSVETQLNYYDWVVSNTKEIQFQSDFSF